MRLRGGPEPEERVEEPEEPDETEERAEEPDETEAAVVNFFTGAREEVEVVWIAIMFDTVTGETCN
jgi:hypothetical protein